MSKRNEINVIKYNVYLINYIKTNFHGLMCTFMTCHFSLNAKVGAVQFPTVVRAYLSLNTIVHVAVNQKFKPSLIAQTVCLKMWTKPMATTTTWSDPLRDVLILGCIIVKLKSCRAVKREMAMYWASRDPPASLAEDGET